MSSSTTSTTPQPGEPDGPVFLISLILIALGCVAALALFVPFWQTRKEKLANDIRNGGKEVLGRITAKDTTSSKSPGLLAVEKMEEGQTSKVSFEFEADGGNCLVDAKRRSVNAAYLDTLQVNDTVSVRYQPSDPRNCVLKDAPPADPMNGCHKCFYITVFLTSLIIAFMCSLGTTQRSRGFLVVFGRFFLYILSGAGFGALLFWLAQKQELADVQIKYGARTRAVKLEPQNEELTPLKVEEPPPPIVKEMTPPQAVTVYEEPVITYSPVPQATLPVSGNSLQSAYSTGVTYNVGSPPKYGYANVNNFGSPAQYVSTNTILPGSSGQRTLAYPQGAGGFAFVR